MFKYLRKKLKGLKDRFYLLFRTKYANQKYLDSILKELVKSEKYMLDIKKLENKLSSFDGAEVLFVYDPSKRYEKATGFLLDRKYIDGEAYHAYRITFEGLIFIENGGFYQDVKLKRKRRWLTSAHTIITIITALISIIISYFALMKVGLK